MTVFLRVSAYNSHPQGGDYQRKEYLWIIKSEICKYKATINALPTFYHEVYLTYIFSCNQTR